MKGMPEDKPMNAQKITVRTTVNRPPDIVWKKWTTPEDVMAWNSASDDWHTPTATNDLRVGGAFNYRMEARDGSFGFDFYGTYDEVILERKIAYTLGDGRNVEILFSPADEATFVTETFDAESENPLELQRDGWQAILDHFKRHAEAV